MKMFYFPSACGFITAVLWFKYVKPTLREQQAAHHVCGPAPDLSQRLGQGHRLTKNKVYLFKHYSSILGWLCASS